MAAYAPCSPQRKVIRNSQEYVKLALYSVKGSHSSICSGTIKATLFHKVKPRKACALGEVGEVGPAPSPCPPTGRRAAGVGGHTLSHQAAHLLWASPSPSAVNRR